MKTFTRDYRFGSITDDLFSKYYGTLTPCVFDIETTGLSAGGRQTSRVILTAMLIRISNGVQITQYLAEQPYEEDQVLRNTLRFLADHEIDYLITYNGMSFDIPFVNRRLEALHLPYRLSMYDLDLYAWLRKNTVLPERLPSMKQKSVERYFRIASDRDDIITGRDSVKLYYEYAGTHSSVIEKIILTHNREDVLQLYRVLQELRQNTDDLLKKDNFHQAEADFGFPVGEHADLTVRPKLTGRELALRGLQHRTVALQRKEIMENADLDESDPEIAFSATFFPDFESNISASFRASASDFEVTAPVERRGKSVYVDLRSIPFRSELARRLALTELNGYVNDYLILCDEKENNYQEINVLSALLLDQVYRRVRSV